jgi:DNA polymerase-3 subunit chi
MAAAVEFHTGVPDVVDFSCRLLRKAYLRGATVLCLAPRARLEALDRSLWTFAEREFVPHVWFEAATPSLRARTPIWLAESLSGASAKRDVLLSLGAEMAPGDIGDDVRLIEVIGAATDEVERGRGLWRRYRAEGREIVHHPYGARAAGPES